MKFGDIIKGVEKGQLTPSTLQALGNRYYEKFDTFFSRLTHSHFDLATNLKNTTNNISSRECCDLLVKQMSKTENTNGWLFEKSLEILNKFLGENIQSHTVCGDVVIGIQKDEILKNIDTAIKKNMKESELKDFTSKYDNDLSNNSGDFENNGQKKVTPSNPKEISY